MRDMAWKAPPASLSNRSTARSTTAVFEKPVALASRSTLATTTGFAIWSAIGRSLNVYLNIINIHSSNCSTQSGAAPQPGHLGSRAEIGLSGDIRGLLPTDEATPPGLAAGVLAGEHQLTSPMHPVGRFKARFFAALGYSADDWQTLEAVLRIQHLSQDAEPGTATPHGQPYTVRAILKGPTGESALVVSVWFVRPSAEEPHFVTAYPGDEQ